MKKLLSAILASLICFSALPVGVFAANEETYHVESYFSQKGSHEVSIIVSDSDAKNSKQSEDLSKNPGPDAQPESFFSKLITKMAKVFCKIEFFFQAIISSLTVALNYSRYQT